MPEAVTATAAEQGFDIYKNVNYILIVILLLLVLILSYALFFVAQRKKEV